MGDLNAIIVKAKSGGEPFSYNGKEQSFDLSEFWSWAQSDLLNNTLRGILAEFIVKKALSIDSQTRTEWDSFDLMAENELKLEIKSSAYLQSWKQNNLSHISFDIAPTKEWNNDSNNYSSESKRSSDYYVFCLLHHKEKESVNPLELKQWTFYVLKTTILDKKKGSQKKISLSSLLKLDPTVYTYQELHMSKLFRL